MQVRCDIHLSGNPKASQRLPPGHQVQGSRAVLKFIVVTTTGRAAHQSGSFFSLFISPVLGLNLKSLEALEKLGNEYNKSLAYGTPFVVIH